MHWIRQLAAAGVMALTLGFAAAAAADAPTLDFTHGKVGDLGLGMYRSAVDYRYPNVRYHSCAAGVCSGVGNDATYLTGRGAVYVLFGSRSNRVNDIIFRTSSYRTNDGIGVGSAIPLGRCFRTSSNPCQHRWRGFTFIVEQGFPYWYLRSGSIQASLDVRGGKVVMIELSNQAIR
jgi:hypothetical protein